MNIKIMCDWCGTTVKTVNSFEKVRDAQQTGDTICQKCRKKVAKIDNWFATAKDRYGKELEMLINKLRTEFRQNVQKGEFDVGKDLQDVGGESKGSRG